MQKTLDPVEPFENELVPSIELDARLSVDAVCIELGTKSAPRFCTITSRLSTSTDFTLLEE